jgi:hypothetical protein
MGVEFLDGGSTAKSNRLAFADGILGVAALWVVLFHATKVGHISCSAATTQPG